MGWDRAVTPAWTIPRAGPACKTDVSYAEQTMAETSATKSLRTTVLRVLLGFLMLTALVAIINVWTDADEDGKVLMSSFVLSAASILILPGAARLDSNRNAPIGVLTVVLTAVASLSMLWLIWFEPQDADALSRVVGTTWLWAVAASLHAWVSLAILPDRSQWMKITAPLLTYSATVLATLVVFEAFVSSEQWLGYLTATLYILAGLANLAVFITHLMGRFERADARLMLDGDDGCMVSDG